MTGSTTGSMPFRHMNATQSVPPPPSTTASATITPAEQSLQGVQHPRAQYQYIKGPVTCVPSGPLDVGASVTPPTRNGSVRAVDAAAATVRGYAGHRDDVEIIKAETYAERISRLGQVTTSHPHETVRSREVHPTGRNASGVTHHRGGSACAPRTAECPAHTHAGASQSRKESNWSHAESGRTSLDLRGRGREDHAGRRQKESVASNADAGNGIETDRRRRSPLRPKTASSIRRAIARVRRGSSGGDNSSCERSAQRLQHRDGRPRACSVSPLRMRHSLTTLSTAEEVEAIGGGWHAGGSMVDNTGGVGGLTASIGNGKNTSRARSSSPLAPRQQDSVFAHSSSRTYSFSEAGAHGNAATPPSRRDNGVGEKNSSKAAVSNVGKQRATFGDARGKGERDSAGGHSRTALEAARYTAAHTAAAVDAGNDPRTDTQMYRAFVERRFSRTGGVGRGGLLFPNSRSQKNGKRGMTKLMCHSPEVPKRALLSSTPPHLTDATTEMFRAIEMYTTATGAAEPSGAAARSGADKYSMSDHDEGGDDILRCILGHGKKNVHLSSEMYCQLVKQTNRCPLAKEEERGFEVLACAAIVLQPPAHDVQALVLGHLALHRGRADHVGGLTLFTHHHLSTDALDSGMDETGNQIFTLPSHEMRAYMKNCFVPGTVFGVTLEETLRQEYYAAGIGEVTSPAPPPSLTAELVPVLVQLLVQTIECLGGVRTEGLFRRSGHAGAQTALKKALYSGDYSSLRRLRDEGRLCERDLPGVRELDLDVYTIADTLKAWLRCMKEPLVPMESYARAVEAGATRCTGAEHGQSGQIRSDKGGSGGGCGGGVDCAECGERGREAATRVLLSLPASNRAALDFVTRFLNKVAGQEDSNRMSAHGLAIVLSPNLLRNPDGDPLIFKANAEAETRFVRILIEKSCQ